MAWGSRNWSLGVLFREERKQLAGQKKGESVHPFHPQSSPSLGLTQDLYCTKPGACQSLDNHGLDHLRGAVWKKMPFSARLVFKQSPRFTAPGLRGTEEWRCTH